VSGQLVTNVGLTIPQTFNTMGSVSVAGGLACYAAYYVVRIVARESILRNRFWPKISDKT
jgi:hypothetical protein